MKKLKQPEDKIKQNNNSEKLSKKQLQQKAFKHGQKALAKDKKFSQSSTVNTFHPQCCTHACKANHNHQLNLLSKATIQS